MNELGNSGYVLLNDSYLSQREYLYNKLILYFNSKQYNIKQSRFLPEGIFWMDGNVFTIKETTDKSLYINLTNYTHSIYDHLKHLPQLSSIPKEGSIIYNYKKIEKLIIESGREEEGRKPKEILGIAWNQDKYWYFAVGSNKKRYYIHQFNNFLNKKNKQELNNNLILLKCEKLKNLLLI